MKCKHKQGRITWMQAAGWRTAIAIHCHDCGERLSLGPSNDVGCEVEIRAAELSADASDATTDEEYGWRIHGDIQADVIDRVLAGWLAREILYGADSDVGQFDWDPTRPVAGQGPGAFAPAATERHGDLRLSAAQQLVATLAMHGDPKAPDHAKQCEQLCDILKAAEGRARTAGSGAATITRLIAEDPL